MALVHPSIHSHFANSYHSHDKTCYKQYEVMRSILTMFCTICCMKNFEIFIFKLLVIFNFSKYKGKMSIFSKDLGLLVNVLKISERFLQEFTFHIPVQM